MIDAARAESELTCPLTADKIDRLARFNSQRADGLLHTEEMKAEMAHLQRLYDKWTRERAAAWNAIALRDSLN